MEEWLLNEGQGKGSLSSNRTGGDGKMKITISYFMIVPKTVSMLLMVAGWVLMRKWFQIFV